MATVELRYSPQDSAWFTANATLVLKAGEPAYHSTTGLFKLGDGTTQLSALPFLPATGGGGGGNFVPYTGATGNVDLGEYQIRVGQLELDQSPTGTAGVTITRWNDTLGSTETTLKGGSVVLKNGVDLVARVVNKVVPNTTLTKAAYQVVKVTGAQGQRLAVNLAQANNDNNSADTLGIVTETIATNQEGFIICVGQIENINTTGSLQGETWADGDVLYLSPTTPGAITKVKPTGATGHIVVLGYVEYAHQNNGKIYVKIMNGWELDELHNVYINAPADNEVLTYENATSLWKNKAISTGLTTGITTIASGTNSRILYNNSGVLGEYAVTGTGTTAVLSTSPTFVTDIKSPIIYGSTSASGTLTVSSTSNVTKGTIQIGSTDIVNIGNKTTTSQRLVRIGQDTAWLDFGSLVGSTSAWAIYGNQATPSVAVAALWGGSTTTNLNGPTTVNVTIQTSVGYTMNSFTENLFQQPILRTSGTGTIMEIRPGANTNQTATSNIPNFKVTGANKQWATGTVANQYWNYLTSNTASFVAASTMTNSYSLFVESAAAGTNATITNNYSLGTSGKAKFGGNIELTQTVTTEALTSDTSVTIVINGTTYKLLAKA